MCVVFSIYQNSRGLFFLHFKIHWSCKLHKKKKIRVKRIVRDIENIINRKTGRPGMENTEGWHTSYL